MFKIKLLLYISANEVHLIFGWNRRQGDTYMFLLIRFLKYLLMLTWFCISNFDHEFINLLPAFVNYVSASRVHSLSHIFCFHYVLCTALLLFKGWMFAFMARVKLKEEFDLERLTGPFQYHNHHNHMSSTAYFVGCYYTIMPHAQVRVW